MDQVASGQDDVGNEIMALTSLVPLVDRIRRLGSGGRRVMIGLAGAPGAGKSTLAIDLVTALEPDLAVVVPLDGFHLAADVIAGTELADRRGAIDTFDGEGFRVLIARLRADGSTVYAPRYAREIEDPIASAITVPPHARFLIVEGNYVLEPSSPWRDARDDLDEIWYLDIDPALRLERLVARHIEFGKSPDAALQWSQGSDERNAKVIEAHRRSADLVINVQNVDSAARQRAAES